MVAGRSLCAVLDTKCELLRAMEVQGELTERRERCEAAERPGFRCDVELCPVGVELESSLHRSTGWRGRRSRAHQNDDLVANVQIERHQKGPEEFPRIEGWRGGGVENDREGTSREGTRRHGEN